jgi:D-alanyl-D-alanine carboxypeptidase (penicillin-binding protein 5/6)
VRIYRPRRLRIARLARVLVVVLLGVAVGRTWSADGGPRATHPVEHVGAGKSLAIAWPAEGEAAVAVDGLGYLGASGGGEPVPIASLAKVMTAYLVLRDDALEPGEEGFEMRIDPADVEDLQRRLAMNQSVVTVEVGEELSERQALEALLLPSANNVAALLAVHAAGSVEAFVAEMNEAAAQLGMGRTHYTDPSGFEDTTVSTAADQLRLARAAMADPTFAQIVAMPATVLPVVGEVANFNELVGQEGFVGIKTGSDQAAGGCLLFARRIEVGGHPRTLLGAVLGQREGDLIPAALASARTLAASATTAAAATTASSAVAPLQ